MKFTPTELAGLYLVDLEPSRDERGFFARSYEGAEFSAHGLMRVDRQFSVSFNARRGTLRGLHYQAAPCEEHKLVRVTAGSIFDVAVDLRAASGTYRRWYGIELSAANRRALYIPAGFAHGFMSLEDASEVLYMISTDYSAGHARGVRWDDPAFGIEWPFAPAVISARDAAYALLERPSR
jgi:dTDP-4-dehydrorhamnose 3,5-epimerase